MHMEEGANRCSEAAIAITQGSNITTFVNRYEVSHGHTVLNSSILTLLSQSQAHIIHLLEDWKIYLSRAESKIIIKIQDLDSKLRNVQQNPARPFDNDDWKKLHDMCAEIRSDVHVLSRSHGIIQSLRYECMEARNEGIKDACKKTFDWMFDSTEKEGADDGLKNTFGEWLQTGSGIYWITGKPGKTYDGDMPSSSRS